MELEEIYKIFEASTGICTDTRKLKKGELFVALSGENFNGNKFATVAHTLGASRAIIDDPVYSIENFTILVEDALVCLQHLASLHRKTLKTPIIAITGSNGKTTTKELLNIVLAQSFTVHCTEGNLNNHIGVPLTLLQLKSEHEIAIIEMGANHIGEIAQLTDIAKPDLGLITNIGKAHLEGFGSLEGIAIGKSELYQYLVKNKGYIFFNEEDPKLIDLLGDYKAVIPYHRSELELLDSDAMELEFNWRKQLISTHLIGDYNLINISCAIKVGEYFKIPEVKIKSALENYQSKNNRSQLEIRAGRSIIMDAYNANPTSMKLSLNNFFGLNKAPSYLILGDMLELGINASLEHQSIIDQLGQHDFTAVFLVGKHFSELNIEDKRIRQFVDINDLNAEFPIAKLPKQAFILLKGSRGIGLEKYLELV